MGAGGVGGCGSGGGQSTKPAEGIWFSESRLSLLRLTFSVVPP